MSAGSSTEVTTLRSRARTFTNRRTLAWMAAVYLIVMFLLMIMVIRTLDHSMRQLAGRAIDSIVSGHVASLQLHIVRIEQEAFRVVSQAPAQAGMVKAIRKESSPEDVTKIISNRSTRDDWVLTDRNGQIVIADETDRLGYVCTFIDPIRERLLREEPVLVVPPLESDSECDPTLFILAPIISKDRLVGAFGWATDPRNGLSDRLHGSPTNATYLFDRDGRVLTRHHFSTASINVASQSQDNDSSDKQSDPKPSRPILLREPGRIISSQDAFTSDELLARPLTKMADQATRGSSGIDTDGYNDYRGVSVIGAWRWLPRLNLGIAMEIDTAEALGPVRLLTGVVIGLFALLSLAGIGVALLAMWARGSKDIAKDSERSKRRLGRYELTELLGVGGMGSVYRGRHEFLRRDVAIKVLEGTQMSAQSIKRFEREVQLTSTLRHPNTIAVFDFGQSLVPTEDETDPTTTLYYVMEYVDGISLQQLIDFYGPQPAKRVVHLLFQICGSISEAHQAGLIHRDIKPANILLSTDANSFDHVKVLDFGLVKEVNRTADTVALTVTHSDSLTGTPVYMAPETIRDATKATTAGDLYSIGAVGYALLTGKPTYEGQSAIDLCLQQLEKSPPTPSERLGKSLDSELEDLIMQCLLLNAEDRPDCITDLIARLESLPEFGCWTQAQSAWWWSDVFEKSGNHDAIKSENPTLADEPLENVS